MDDAEAYMIGRNENMEKMQEIARKYFKRILSVYPKANLNFSPLIKVWKVTAGRDEDNGSNLFEVDIAEDGGFDIVSSRYGTYEKRRDAKSIIEAWALALKEIY